MRWRRGWETGSEPLRRPWPRSAARPGLKTAVSLRGDESLSSVRPGNRNRSFLNPALAGLLARSRVGFTNRVTGGSDTPVAL
jgi:hypothetical protein